MTLVDNRNNTHPYINLAIEEFLVRHADCTGQDYLLLYINQPCFVLGKNQSIYREVNFDFLRNEKLLPARRISGGGTVYHDEGNLNFAFISGFANNKVNNYLWFNTPLVNALQQAGVKAETDSRNNIICGGKKISGNAQFTDRKNMISHGTLLFNANLNLLRACQAPNSFEVETKAVSSVKSSVINIAAVTSAFKTIAALKDYLATRLCTGETRFFTEAEWQKIEHLATEKFESFEWIYGRSPDSVIKKKDMAIHVQNGKISSIKTSLKLPALEGINYCYPDIKKALAGTANASGILSLVF